MNSIQKKLYFRNIFNELEIDITDDQIEELASFFTEKEYKKGSIILSEGDSHPLAAFIDQGLVKMCLTTIEGKEFISSLFIDGTLFMNFTHLTENKPSSSTFIALEDCKLYVGDYDVVAKNLFGKLYWHLLKEKYYHNYFMTRARRETNLLTLEAKDRYLAMKEDYPEIIKRASQQSIALYLGISPISLSRIIKSLKA